MLSDSVSLRWQFFPMIYRFSDQSQISACLFAEVDELILTLYGNAMDLEWLKQL